jgi:hypothetical protein
MSTVNILEQVKTYQMAELAYFQNQNCFISTANTKFQNFQDIKFNLGSTVDYELPPRFSVNDGLVASFQPIEQRVRSLTVNKAKNLSVEYTSEQFIFNLEEYMDRVGKGAIKRLGAEVEKDIAKLAETTAYRFFGDGTTAINSYGQLAQILALYRNYGDVEDIKIYLPDINIPSIVNNGLNQFVIDRNEKLAQSWMLGDFDGASFYRSNQLPIHTSGNLGEAGTTLTVVSTNDPTGNNITQITFSGAGGADANAVKQFDSLYFLDGVSGKPNLRYLTFMGQSVSANQVQVQVTADAGSSGGNVTVNITPGLSTTAGQNQNINTNIVAGMQAKIIPSHRCGFIVGGKAMYIAMPRLPNTQPFASSNMVDEDTGVSLRMYYGNRFGENQYALIHDVIYGFDAVPEYCMKIAFPLV